MGVIPTQPSLAGVGAGAELGNKVQSQLELSLAQLSPSLFHVNFDMKIAVLI